MISLFLYGSLATRCARPTLKGPGNAHPVTSQGWEPWTRSPSMTTALDTVCADP